jgi:hypothetical protein
LPDRPGRRDTAVNRHFDTRRIGHDRRLNSPRTPCAWPSAAPYGPPRRPGHEPSTTAAIPVRNRTRAAHDEHGIAYGRRSSCGGPGSVVPNHLAPFARCGPPSCISCEPSPEPPPAQVRVLGGIEGDIAQCFDRLDHSVMLRILGEEIHDNRFLRLVRNMLTAGYMEDWIWNATHSGSPQGGVFHRSCRISTCTRWMSTSREF